MAFFMVLQNYYVYTCMYLQEHQCTFEMLEIYWSGVSLGFPTAAQVVQNWWCYSFLNWWFNCLRVGCAWTLESFLYRWSVPPPSLSFFCSLSFFLSLILGKFTTEEREWRILLITDFSFKETDVWLIPLHSLPCSHHTLSCEQWAHLPELWVPYLTISVSVKNHSGACR